MPVTTSEAHRCRYCGGAGKFQIVSPVSDGAWAACFCSRPALSPVEITEAIRKAKVEADKTYGIAWHHLEEVSRVELILAALK
jgi:hypothetical protein